MSPGNGSVRPLVVIGSGGFGRETVETVRAINAEHPTWDLLGFLDDDPALHGKQIDDVPVLGPIDEARTLFVAAQLVVCTGHPGNYFSKKRIVERLALPESRYGTIVHPTAALSTSSRVGRGSVLLAHVVATASVQIGAHVSVMPNTIFTHDDVIEDYATFGAGVRLAGRVTVEAGAYVGSGALIREDRTIGAWSLLGMGSILTKDVPPGEVWIGAPASFLRPVDPRAIPSYGFEAGASAERRLAGSESGQRSRIMDRPSRYPGEQRGATPRPRGEAAPGGMSVAAGQDNATEGG
jgi:sugar O-acyltransferase (sialic acid O-acetyltransferase NeuD family)